MADTQKGTVDINAVFQGLTIEPANEPLPEPARGGAPSGPNPFKDPLLASVEHKAPYTFYVPKEAVQRAVFLINAAARKENKGVRIVVDVQRDKDGKPVKGADGKVQYAVQADGAHKGTVRIRFQGQAERKQQTTPRPYSIVKDKSDATGNTYIVRERATKRAVFSGTHEAAKAKYDELKTQYLNTPAAPTPPPTVQTDAAAAPEQSATPATSPAGAEAPAA